MTVATSHSWNSKNQKGDITCQPIDCGDLPL